MKTSTKAYALLLYLVGWMPLASTISSMPLTPATVPLYALFVGLFVAGLAILVAPHYVLPFIIRNWRLDRDCSVYDAKYIVCKHWSGMVVAKAILKLIPKQTIVDLPRERREAVLQGLATLHIGIEYDIDLVYSARPDPYAETVIERLRGKKRFMLMFATRMTPSLQDKVSEVDREMRLLQQTPSIYTGHYLAIVYAYGRDVHEAVERLKTYVDAVRGKAEQAYMEARLAQGEELNVFYNSLKWGRLAWLYK